MTIPTKRRRVTNLRLREISTVDRPAQIGAVAVLIKRQGEEDVTRWFGQRIGPAWNTPG